MDADLRVSAKTVLSSRLHMGNLGHGVCLHQGGQVVLVKERERDGVGFFLDLNNKGLSTNGCFNMIE